MDRIQEIELRLQAIDKEFKEKTDMTSDEVKARSEEIKKLIAEKAVLIERQKQEAMKAFEDPQARSIANPGEPKKDPKAEAFEKRCEAFKKTTAMTATTKELRAAMLSTNTGFVRPTGYDTDVVDNLTSPIGLLQRVRVVAHEGLEGITLPYKKTRLTAATYTEGSAPTESENTYGKINVTPDKYAVISYFSEDIKRATPIDYTSTITADINEAFTEKAESLILTKIPASVDSASAKLCGTLTLTETAINEKTLRHIVLGYKPGKRYRGSPVLLLNTEQLMAFGDVRGTNDKKAVYDVRPTDSYHGMLVEGTTAVEYIICDELTTMLYGHLAAVELHLFGEERIGESEHYKFAEGLIAVRGETWFACTLRAQNAFTTVEFATASA